MRTEASSALKLGCGWGDETTERHGCEWNGWNAERRKWKDWPPGQSHRPRMSVLQTVRINSSLCRSVNTGGLTVHRRFGSSSSPPFCSVVRSHLKTMHHAYGTTVQSTATYEILHKNTSYIVWTEVASPKLPAKLDGDLFVIEWATCEPDATYFVLTSFLCEFGPLGRTQSKKPILKDEDALLPLEVIPHSP